MEQNLLNTPSQVNSENLEVKTKELGKEIFRRIKSSKSSFFDRSFWSTKIMDIGMKNETLKTELFRFVDVLPTLKSEEQLSKHIQEYFGNFQGEYSELVKFASQFGSGSFLGKLAASFAIKTGVTQMAKTFIAGENLKEVTEKAKELRKKKIIKQRLYKEFLLSGRVKCTECGSNMTPCFANKPKRRYYYYKCYKVIREGGHACGLKEVNAEKLETFLVDNLSRIAQDKQYTENLAFKIAYETPGVNRLEPTKAWVQNFSTRVSQVLMEFKNRVQNANQVEKCLIFEKTIKSVKFSRETLEVTISIEDHYCPVITQTTPTGYHFELLDSLVHFL